MTVAELIAELKGFDPSLTVYVPGNNQKAEIAALVGPMPHLGIEFGVSIPDDVYIMSQEFADDLDVDQEAP
jgi:hypothetical protein